MRYLLFAACSLVVACSGSPKPCPVALKADYARVLHVSCPDAGTVAELEECPSFPALKAEHNAEQLDAGCRVKP